MYDVIIVGAGPAGCHVARKLDGLNVLVIEKDKKVFPKDSGIVSKDFFSFYGRNFVKSEISQMKMVSPSGSSFYLRSKKPFAFILHREKFLKYARKKINIVHETVNKIEYKSDCVYVYTEKNIYRAKMIVGADGAYSIVRRFSGIKNPGIVTGVMVKTRKIKEKDIIVFFRKSFSPDFFSWIIPKNKEYGLISKNPKKCLDEFRFSLGLEKGDIYSSPIPIGFVKSFSERTILLGDAAGQVKPLTGGGIVFGLKAATHAGNVIKSGYDLSVYEKLWKKDFANEIRKELLIRKFYSKMSNRQIDEIFADFGKHIENLEDFDYDHFTATWKNMPKMKMMKFFLRNLIHIKDIF